MHKDEDWTLPAGSLLHVTQGEYSDYRIDGHFVALQKITADMVRSIGNRFVEQLQVQPEIIARSERRACWKNTEPKNVTEAREEAIDIVLPEMIRRGWLLSINSHEIHLGSYGFEG